MYPPLTQWHNPNSPQCKPELGRFFEVVSILCWVSARLYRFITSGKFLCSGTRCPGNQTGKYFLKTCPWNRLGHKFEKSKNLKRIAGSFILKNQFFEGVWNAQNLPIFWDSASLKIPGSGWFFDSHFFRNTRGWRFFRKSKNRTTLVQTHSRYNKVHFPSHAVNPPIHPST